MAYGESDLRSIAQHLQQNHPVIVFVDTAELPYWHYGCNHAVVIIGLGDDIVILNDPAFADVAQHVSVGDFEWVHSPKGGWRLKSRLWAPSGRMSAYADTDHPSAQADAQP